MRLKTLVSFFLLPSFFLLATDLLKEDLTIDERSKLIIPLYDLPDNVEWKDITDAVIKNPTTSEDSKHAILAHKRTIILFKYPSDDLFIKAFLSFTPNPEHHPLLILFRGGNRNFALLNPGIAFATYGDYTVVSSALRGGVSQGTDEFGGKDVDDVKNLIDYLPTISKKIGIALHPHCTFMLGPSRGGLEMFLTLAKYQGLQQKIDKVATLSSILDLHEQIKDRPLDMKTMFESDFGMTKANEEDWIEKRNPLNSVSKLSPSLPILIVQGTNDPRINLKEGYNMVEALQKSGRKVDYWEVPGGGHTLSNISTMPDSLAHWFESNLNCYGKDSRVYTQKGKQNDGQPKGN